MASAKLMIPKRSAPYYVLTANVTVHGKRVRRYGRFDFDPTVLKTHRQRENAAIEAALVFERAEQQKADDEKDGKNTPFRDVARAYIDSKKSMLDPSVRLEGDYEQHKNKANTTAGKETMPVIVRDLDDDAATIIMVDSNLQREELLPSERAFAYKMKLEALKHQGARTDLTSRQVVGKLEMADIVGKNMGESGRQVQRFIRLTELIPTLLDMVDERKIALNPALLLEAMDSEQATPSLSQAQRLKKFSQQKMLSLDVMRAVMSEEKKTDLDRVTLKNETLRKYFPKSYTPKQMEDTIIKLLEGWYKKRQLSQER